MTDDEKLFTCPRCGFNDKIFHQVCPECRRPYFRDYIDTRFFPRDPNPQGIYKGKFWARVFLVLMLFGLALGILVSFHII
jgi:hypothetical protein